MDYNKLFKWKDERLYFVVIGFLLLIIGFFKPILAIILALAFSFLIYNYVISIKDKEREWVKYIENLSEEFDTVTKHAVFNMPFPLTMLERDGRVTWYNTSFIDMMEDKDILHKNIREIISDIDAEKILMDMERKPISIEYNNKYYDVYYNIIDRKKSLSKNDDTIVLYWVDKTEKMNFINRYNNEKMVVCLAYIDNFDEVKNTTPEINRPLVFAEIDKTLSTYAAMNDGLVRKYENDKYILIFENKFLKQIINRKFEILDKIREIDMGNTISITLSMGWGANGKNPNQVYENAKSAVEIALGRGGDQAVIKEDGNLSFYGGKTKAIEKSNKVKSRVISHALMQLIDQAEEVFIMGHKNADMDSFGACIGILRAVKNRDKKGHIILRGPNPSIRNIYNRMKEEVPDYMESIISPERAVQIIDRTCLLVVVDNHKPSFTESMEVLDLTDKIVLIDHHRRGAEFIKDPILTYLESYASSTCELVTELLFYMSEKMEISKFDANALLAGITVDTKNFTYQTGVRTFEAAALLKRAGADSESVREFFKDDYHTFLHKAEVTTSSKVVFNNIAIGRLEEEMEDSVLIAAQAANELLNVNGIEASFVLTLADSKVHISGRSLGTISAQLILEALGGGGHLTSAGTQIADKTMDEVEKILIEAIEDYLKESER